VSLILAQAMNTSRALASTLEGLKASPRRQPQGGKVHPAIRPGPRP
jgi:hypothetical protein